MAANSEPSAYNFESIYPRASGLDSDGLTILSARERKFMEDWAQHIDHVAPPGLIPNTVTSRNQPEFTRFLHKAVADSVAFDNDHRQHRVIERDKVVTEIRNYYRQFPSDKTLTSQQRLAKSKYQDERLALAELRRQEFREIDAALALRRAYRERRQRYATKAAFALLTAYGGVLLSNSGAQ